MAARRGLAAIFLSAGMGKFYWLHDAPPGRRKKFPDARHDAGVLNS
ncbi:hypothetical protein C7S13_0622 [Burkholderia cepacia]|nr:hypothetical protein [Burkholderia cepacia]